MPKFLDLTGHKYGRLTAIRRTRQVNGNTMWECECECGDVREYCLGNIRGGHSTQCKKCGKKQAAESVTIHGMSGSAEYHAWNRRKQDGCLCERWMKFEAFISDMGNAPEGKTCLARSDQTKPHSPSNSYWSKTSQNKGRMQYRVNGEIGHSSYWAGRLGITKERMRQLIVRHGSVEEVIKFRAARRGKTMAEVIDDFPADKDGNLMGSGRPSKYNWDEWSDGQVWSLKQGEDFGIKIESFRQNAHSYASNNGMKVTTRIMGDCVYLQFRKSDD